MTLVIVPSYYSNYFENTAHSINNIVFRASEIIIMGFSLVALGCIGNNLYLIITIG